MEQGIRQLERNRWAVRVKRLDVTLGRVRNLKATVTGTFADAIRKRDELRAKLARQQRARQRLDEYAAAWLLRRKDTLSPATVRKYFYAIRSFRAELGAIYLDALTPGDVERYVAVRVRCGAAGHTVLNELRLLRTIARDTVNEGLAARYWCERVRAPKVRRYTSERPNLLTAEQAARLLRAVPPQWLSLVVFVATTGLRWGEASALRWEDVDVVAGVARISRSNWKGLAKEPKNKSSYRAVPILEVVLELLRRGRGGELPSAGLVFPARGGELHRGSPLRAVLDRACAIAGVPRITPHGLRRTFNNEGRKRGTREVLKSITGHLTDQMVEHYSVVGAAEKAELSALVASAIGVPEVSGSRTV